MAIVSSNISTKQKANFIIALIAIIIFILEYHPAANKYWEEIKDKFYSLSKNEYFGGSNYLPRNYQIAGIDISHHQGRIIWSELRKAKIENANIDFVFMKSTEGKRFRDKKFIRNWKQAKTSGILRGAYHYYKPSTNSTSQAENFINAVSLEVGDLPPVLDIEEEGEHGIENTRKGILNWLQLVEKEYQIKPIIYTNPNHYRMFFEGEKQFSEYYFWIANYYKRRPSINHNRVIFWQYTDNGSLQGIYEKVDLNVFKGKKEELLKVCKK